MTNTGKTHIRRWLASILIGLFIIAFAAGFAWWQHYKTTPAYSLALLVDAAQRNDAAAFDELIDMDKVVDNFTPQVVDAVTGGVAAELAGSLRVQLQALAPGVLATVKQTIKEEVRKRINELAGSSGARPFLLTALAIRFKVNISESNKTAKATIDTGSDGVELFMERSDDSSWRIISLRDDALATRIARDRVKGLPGLELQLDKEMRKQLPERLPELPRFRDK
jgi:hypothetical protein